MRHANTGIGRNYFPTPTIDDLIFKLKGTKYFTKWDVNSSFHQLELYKDSRYITAFQTEYRTKRFKRLIFGLISPSEHTQHYLQMILADILGTINIADDILIFAESITEHDEILKHAFQRLYAKELTLNLSKYIFSKELWSTLALFFQKQGWSLVTQKKNTLKNAERPQGIRGICSYMGMVNYLKCFILDFSTVTYPLRQLMHKNTQFVWTDACKKSFILYWINSLQAQL